MSDWTAEAQAAIDLCSSWASKIPHSVCSDLFLFGSVIYKSGEQFDALNSDLDIVAVFNPDCSALDRSACLSELASEKLKLELSIIPALGREICNEPAISIVPSTRFEIKANIHKSGARRFFDRNTFLNLRNGEISLGLEASATLAVRDENRNALEYVQPIRSKYLSKAANSTGGLKAYSGSDPMPKALLRFAAQLVGESTEGEWYDTRYGLELMFDKLRERRLENEALKKLFDLISIRRGGRGIKNSLDDTDQLVLTELLFDLAASGPTEDILIWEIRFSQSSGFAQADYSRIKNQISRLIPNSVIIDSRMGSLILRIRSSASSFELLDKLNHLSVLAKIFEVDSVELAVLDLELDGHPEFSNDREQQLLRHISAWRPLKGLSGRGLENSLQQWLEGDVLPSLRDDSGFAVMREMSIEHSGKHMLADFVVWWKEKGQADVVAIELKQMRSRRQFVQAAERLLDMPFRICLVLVGEEDILETVRDDIDRLGRSSGKLKIVPISYADQ